MKGQILTRWVRKKEPSMDKYQRQVQKWLCLFYAVRNQKWNEKWKGGCI